MSARDEALDYLHDAAETGDLPFSTYMVAKAQAYALLDIADAIRNQPTDLLGAANAAMVAQGRRRTGPDCDRTTQCPAEEHVLECPRSGWSRTS